jgi:formate hydrogenlyase subunit 3/multisubunit Na+/H+ antiporter MnhD subunit
MIYPSLILLVAGAAACFGLSGRVAARSLGLGAALLCLIGGLLYGLPAGQGGALLPLTALGAAAGLPATLSSASGLLAASALLAAAGCLLSLALALPPQLRGFGAIFGWAMLGIATVPSGLAVGLRSPLLVGIWAVAALAGYAAYRASGALRRNERAPLGVSIGLLAGLLLLGGQLGGGPLAAICLLGGALALAGAAPFQGANREAVLAPAPLGALFYAIVLPFLGLGPLIEGTRNLPAPPDAWGQGLLAIGSLGACACAAGMLGQHSLRAMLGWGAGMQLGAALAAIGLAGLDRPLGELAAQALLINLALSATASAAAVSALEQATGSDDYTQPPQPGLGLAGLLWLVGGASALGLPPLWGFWGRLWLLDGLLREAAWAAPLLVGAGLLALAALLVPLACFWSNRPLPQPPARSAIGRIIGGLPAAVILAFAGLVPQSAVRLWLGSLEISPLAQAVSLAAGGALLLFGLALARARWARVAQLGPESSAVSLAPESLGAQLGLLASIGRPDRLASRGWASLYWLSERLQSVMSIFEQRYYLLGVILVLISIMLLMAR